MAMSMSATTNKKNRAREERGGAFENGAGRSGEGSSRIIKWERETRSLSPVRHGARASDNAEMIKTQAQMAVLAEATDEVCRRSHHPYCLGTAGIYPRRSVSANRRGG